MVSGFLLNGSDWSESKCRAIVVLKNISKISSKCIVSREGGSKKIKMYLKILFFKMFMEKGAKLLVLQLRRINDHLKSNIKRLKSDKE